MEAYCTLFDSNYLNRGIALYESMLKHCKPFHLYIFAFDTITFKILSSSNMPNATIIALDEFEDEALLLVKPGRTKGEYCWTSTSSAILYVLDKFKVSRCTYVDADLYFFASPGPVFSEFHGNNILITEHRYTREYDQSSQSGIYCVQFITFNADEKGLKALRWWRDACIDWCYDRHEDGKFGDQKYLDDWKERFPGVHVLANTGAGVAPWNVQQYKFRNGQDKISGTGLKNNSEFDLIFYHFHDLALFDDNNAYLGPYKISSNAIETIYKPYLEHLTRVNKRLTGMDSNIPVTKQRVITLESRYKDFRRLLKQSYNIYPVNKIIDGPTY